MAEFLVLAKGHWQDNLSKQEIASMTEEQKAKFDRRPQKGDIVCVRPDGWEWGKSECLPDFIVYKIPGMTVEEAMKYEEPVYENKVNVLGDTVPEVVKFRKHQIPVDVVDADKIAVVDSEKQIDISLKDTFVANITDKTKAVVKDGNTDIEDSQAVGG